MRTPEGESTCLWTPPFDESALDAAIARFVRARRGVRSGSTSENGAARAFGSALFDSLTATPAGGLVSDALRTHPRVRVCIETRAPALAAVPWEFLRDSAGREFLAMSADSPVVRRTAGGTNSIWSASPIALVDALDILVVTSSPRDRERVYADEEWDLVRDGVRDLARRGAVRLDRLDHPTPRTFLQKMRERPRHVVHFVGHGAYDELRDEGVLYFEDEQRLSLAMTAQHLATLLRDEKQSVRLVVLNACEGARLSARDSSAGVAQSLAAAGLPIVVAMQFEITADAAATFASGFYSSLAQTGAADAALADARKLLADDRYGAQWGAPALFLASDDARVFVSRVEGEPLLAYLDITTDDASRPGQGTFPLRQPRVLIGSRVHPPDIMLDDVHVSAMHAEVRVADDRVFVRDTRSTNGTYVDDETERIVGERELVFGQSVRIRPYRVRILSPENPPYGDGKTQPLPDPSA